MGVFGTLFWVVFTSDFCFLYSLVYILDTQSKRNDYIHRYTHDLWFPPLGYWICVVWGVAGARMWKASQLILVPTVGEAGTVGRGWPAALSSQTRSTGWNWKLLGFSFLRFYINSDPLDHIFKYTIQPLMYSPRSLKVLKTNFSVRLHHSIWQ